MNILPLIRVKLGLGSSQARKEAAAIKEFWLDPTSNLDALIKAIESSPAYDFSDRLYHAILSRVPNSSNFKFTPVVL